MPRMVRSGHLMRSHFVQSNAHAAIGKLTCTLASSKTSADNAHDLIHKKSTPPLINSSCCIVHDCRGSLKQFFGRRKSSIEQSLDKSVDGQTAHSLQRIYRAKVEKKGQFVY